MTEPSSIRELIGYRLQKAIVLTTKSTHASFGAKFNVTGVEWRLIGNLSMDGPLSLRQLSEETDIKLPQASRTIASLIERGLVQGKDDAQDGRRVMLSLTTDGRALYRKVFAEAKRRHQELLAILSEKEQHDVFQALEKLAEHGRALQAASKA